jgi:hypothetical protein
MGAGASSVDFENLSDEQKTAATERFNELTGAGVDEKEAIETIKGEMQAENGDNLAFVFIKPHANTPAVQALMKEKFTSSGITVLQEGELTGEQIDQGKLIDQHYYAIASKATILKPADMPVPADKFESAFGVAWAEVLEGGKAYNALDACEYFGVDSEGINELWQAVAAEKKLVKLGGGFYCGLVSAPAAPAQEAAGEVEEPKAPIYVFNGFFMSMRAKFVQPGTSIHWYVASFSPETLSWADFRGKVRFRLILYMYT